EAFFVMHGGYEASLDWFWGSSGGFIADSRRCRWCGDHVAAPVDVQGKSLRCSHAIFSDSLESAVDCGWSGETID
ncbi:MAG TPA: hypothetical protein PK710_16025, partial [Polyangiaceae bacterium]|nr:hypothetical protein [Polyangiaceae bacterium]